MLEDFKFAGPTMKAFFGGGLEAFRFPKKEGRRQTVDVVATINAIGDTVTQKTSLLEEITGHLSPGFLPRWIARSPRLQSMVLWKGDALSDGAGAAIAANCEHFRYLTIREWLAPDADQAFARFLNDLREDMLAEVEIISYNSIGEQSFKALGKHRSLQVLKLANLSEDTMTSLDHLKGCTELHTLVLEDSYGTAQLELRHNDVFMGVVDWLSSCSNLKDITLKRMFDAPAILARVASSPSVKLKKISIESYTVRGPSAAAFHTALSDQQSLESVWLKGNGEDTNSDDLLIMVQALCNLTNLRELVLKDVSDEFEESHIESLALHLPSLEDFWTSGGDVSGKILPALANLKNLRNLTLYAMTQFGPHEILDFVSGLDPITQRGFNLSLMAQDPEYDLSETQQTIIRDVLRTTLEGRFEFVLWREADLSDSEEE